MSEDNIHRFHDFRSFSQFVFENGAATTRKTVAIRLACGSVTSFHFLPLSLYRPLHRALEVGWQLLATLIVEG